MKNINIKVIDRINSNYQFDPKQNIIGKQYEVCDNSYQHCINTGKNELISGTVYTNKDLRICIIFCQPVIGYDYSDLKYNEIKRDYFVIVQDKLGRLHRVIFQNNWIINKC
jgi:hypothetical protein